MKRVMTVGRRTKNGIIHIVSNSVVPGADVTSDFLTFLELLEHGDVGWAMAVLVFMFVQSHVRYLLNVSRVTSI